MSWWSRIANVWRGDRLSREIDEELRSHMDEAMEQGRDTVEAQRAFGSALRTSEESREVRLIPWLDSLRADAVFGWRQLRKRKVTSAAAILSLALAIGACTSAFRLIDALLLRPLPVAHPERLYALSRPSGKSNTYDGWEYLLLQEMRAAVKGQAELIALSYAERVDLTIGNASENEKAHVQYVSGWMFGSLGLLPTLGRLLTENDDIKPGAHPVAVISYDYWTRRFSQDPKVIGRTFQIGKNLYEIVGVTSTGFTGTEPGTAIDIFMPTMMHWGITEPGWTLFRTFLSLRPGVAMEPVRGRLQATLKAFNQERAKRLPESKRSDVLNQVLLMETAAAGVSGMQKEYRRSLTALCVLVALVLLIACANVANLLTAQATARAREMALRVSIGAGRRRLVQLVLVESAMLALLAAAVGGLFAWWSAPFVVSMINPPDNPAHLFLPADWRVFGFGLALTITVTVLFGLAPALQASTVNPANTLKGGEHPYSRHRLMRALITVQAAFCFVVLFVAGLFVVSFNRLSNQPTGFSAEGLLAIKVVTPRNEPVSLWDQVAEHLRTVPGIASVAYADWPLLDGYSFKVNAISISGAPPSETPAWFMNVSPGWIGTMKLPLIDGRDFRATDASPGAAIVNEAFAKQYFDGDNPIGRWFEGTSGYMRGQRFQIVGLVRDARYRYIREPVLPVAYTPFRRMDDKGTMTGGTIIVRTSSPNPLSLSSILRSEVSRIRSEFRTSSIRTQQELNESQSVRDRLLAMLALFFAGVALLLASIGLYGVLDYSVQQRRREIGIRMALGAPAAHIARRVTFDVLIMVLVGALTGVLLSKASVRYIESLLYQVKATDFGALEIPSLAILAAALLAALPAVIRAVRIDPVSILRCE